MGDFGQNFTLLPTGDDFPGIEGAIAFLSKWGRVVCISFGIPGNLISFLVTTKKDNRRISACVYMAALSVVDSIVLTSRIIYGALMSLDPTMKGNEFYLRCHWYIYRSAALLSSLFLAEMTIDRAINILYPMKATRLCAPSTVHRVVFFTVLSQLIIHINVFFTYSISHPPTGLLKRSVPGAEWVEALFDNYQLIFGAILPFILIAGGNALIIVAVRRASRQRETMTADVTSRKSQLQDHSITRILVLVSIAYVVCSAPIRLYEAFLTIPGLAPMYQSGQRYWNLRRNLQSWAISEIWNLNFAVNFYLYLLGGGKKLRRDVYELFTSCFKWKKCQCQG